MKKYYLGIVFLLVLFIAPIKGKAYCTYSEKIRLKKLASNVSFSYRSVENIGGTITFQVTVSNLQDELYMIDKSSGRTYYSNNQDFIIDGYLPGKTIEYEFYDRSGQCIEGVIFTNYVTFPFYNSYYNSRLCEQAQEFRLCQKWLKHKMSYRDLADEINKYKETKKEEIVKQEEPKEPDYEKIVDFWAKYYIYILVGIIAVCISIMWYLDKKTDL